MRKRLRHTPRNTSRITLWFISMRECDSWSLNVSIGLRLLTPFYYTCSFSLSLSLCLFNFFEKGWRLFTRPGPSSSDGFKFQWISSITRSIGAWQILCILASRFELNNFYKRKAHYYIGPIVSNGNWLGPKIKRTIFGKNNNKGLGNWSNKLETFLYRVAWPLIFHYCNIDK